ncbi:hypothetical protein G5714_024677 [Onychostoma macrolepis]|uniref:Uncharacterized protein n=1 Tax=Onychostoma macrolepis TaxID=369639 RepID=A0A7J6BK60_9TELE|nr:hypothetical protein G5714_024677 [Onychostoma macrolepis]
MFGPSPVFDLVVFERNSSRVHSRGRAERPPWSGRRKRPEATVPAAGGDKLCQTRGRSRPPGPLSNAAFPESIPPRGPEIDTPASGTPTHLLHPSYPTPKPATVHLSFGGTSGEPPRPVLQPNRDSHISRVTDSTNRALRRTGPLVTLGEIYRWSPGKSLPLVTRERFTAGNQDLGQRGDSLTPTLPPQGTRTSGRGATLLHPSTRLRNQDLGQRGHSPAPPLPASGNQDLGQRGHSPAPLYPPQEPGPRAEGPLSCTPLPPQEPGPRAEATLLHPLYRLRNQDLGQRRLSYTTLPASGNQDLGQRGHSPAPLYRLGEPGPRAEGRLSYTHSTRLREPGARSEGPLSRTPPPLVPRIDLGFGRRTRTSRVPGDSASPTHGTTTPAEGHRAHPSARLREPGGSLGGALSRTPPPLVPRIDLGFPAGHPPGHWYPGHRRGSNRGRRVGLLLGRQRLDRGRLSMDRSECVSREAALVRRSRSSHEWLSAPAGPEVDRLSQANQSPAALRYRHV